MRKLAEGQNVEASIAEPPQPRCATRLLASPQRAGQVQGDQGSEVGQGLNAVLGFLEFQKPANPQALPPAPKGISNEVWSAMAMMFGVKYATLQQKLSPTQFGDVRIAPICCS